MTSMTLTQHIIVNAVLGSLVVYGLISLLVHGILKDRQTASPAEVRTVPVRDRLAA